MTFLGTPARFWAADVPPASPHSLNDEFDDGVIDAAWNEWDEGSGLFASESNSHLLLQQNWFPTLRLAGYFKAVPGVNDYQIVAKVMHRNPVAGSGEIGIFLSESLQANPSTADLICLGLDLTSIRSMHRVDYVDAAPTVYATQSWGLPHAYLRLRWQFSTVSFDVSLDGQSWFTITDSQANPLTGNPVHFGVYNTNQFSPSTSRQQLVDWVRVVENNSVNTMYGGFTA